MLLGLLEFTGISSTHLNICFICMGPNFAVSLQSGLLTPHIALSSTDNTTNNEFLSACNTPWLGAPWESRPVADPVFWQGDAVSRVGKATMGWVWEGLCTSRETKDSEDPSLTKGPSVIVFQLSSDRKLEIALCHRQTDGRLAMTTSPSA